jgi:hypothetical protein
MSSALGSPARQAVRARCPVTQPIAHAAPPARMHAPAVLRTPDLPGWYGNAALWVGVPPHGILPAERVPGTPFWGTKFPWWRAIPGTLTITARKLDGPSAGFHANVPTGYTTLGFAPSGLYWPSPGCWQVTGTVSHHSLSIVMSVQATRS